MKNFFALLWFALYLAGCSTQEAKHSLTFGIQQAPTSLDPAATTDLIYYQIAFNIFETLVAVDWETGEFVPALATAWQSDSSGLRWRFSLRRGVMFHDGTPFNAEAVKISFERQFDANSPYYRPNRTDTYGTVAFNMLQEINALNDSTVEFVLECPGPAFLDNLATPLYATIASPRALTELGENFGLQPVGTGPFQFGRWEPDHKIVIKKFSPYWGKAAQLDSVIYQIMPNLDARIQALQQGRADLISGVSAASVDQLLRLRGVTVVDEPLSLGTVILGMKCQTYPFSKIEVRRAIAHAINKKDIVINVSRGLAILARGPLSPELKFYDGTLASPDFDPVVAKALLQSADYKNGFSLSLNHYIDTDTLRASPLAQALKAGLEKTGLSIHLVAYHNWPDYQADILDGNKGQLFLIGWTSHTRHPDNFLYSFFYSQSPHNYFNYKNLEVDRLLEQARQTLEVEQQRRLYRRVQEIILDEAPAVFISHPKVVYVRRDGVKNFKATPLYIPLLHEVELE
jgi:peptide/nickel transport system substrate-binding protein